MASSTQEVVFSRHLDEIDDLETYGRDAPLYSSYENERSLEAIVELFLGYTKRHGAENVLILTSPKLRARQTAELIRRKFQGAAGRKFGYKTTVYESLKAIEQGELILPKGYKAGDRFEGLDVAHKIFNYEVHADPATGKPPNPAYRFGDPIKRKDGSYKYPELTKYFSEPGESYAVSMARLLRFALILGQMKTPDKTAILVVGHGQTFHVLKDVMAVVHSGRLPRRGDLLETLWGIYLNSPASEKKTGVCKSLDTTALANPTVQAYLKSEIAYLESL